MSAAAPPPPPGPGPPDDPGADGLPGVPVPVPAELAVAPPGPVLGALLEDIDVETVSGYDTVEVLCAEYRQLCRQAARFYRAVLETGLRTPFSITTVQRVNTPGEFAAEEARAALVWSRTRAERAFGLALDLFDRLPQLGAAMLAGELDEPRARAFIDWTAGLTDAQAGTVCDQLLPDAAGLMVGELIDRIKRACLAIDPNWAEQRYREAVKSRRVHGSRNPDGTANLGGYSQPVDRIAAASERIDTLARACKHAGDTRPIDLIRSDLFLGMTDGTYEAMTEHQIITHVLTHPYLLPGDDGGGNDGGGPDSSDDGKPGGGGGEPDGQDGEPGDSAGGLIPDAAAVNALLAEIGGLLGAMGPASRPLLLPGGLGCYAAPTGTGLRLGLRTGAPITLAGSGALDLNVWLDVDASRTPTPGGTLSLRLPLDGAPWGEVELILGSGPDGATLAITPSGLGATVNLLPAVTGLTALAGGGAELLLAAALNALVERLRARPGDHQLLDAPPPAATAFGVYDEATAFDGDRLTALAADLATRAPDATTARHRAQAAAPPLDLPAPAATATATARPASLARAALAVSADLAGVPPELTVTLAGATAGTAGASVTADVTAGTGVQGSVTLAAEVEIGQGVTLRPAITATAGGAELRPLGDTTVVLPLAPRAELPSPEQAALIATRLALPMAVAAVLDDLGAALDRPLWVGGPSPSGLLEAAGLITAGGEVAASTPTARTVLDGVLGELAGTEVPAGGELVVALASDGDRYGLALRGPIALPADAPVTLHLGLPEERAVGTDPQVTGVREFRAATQRGSARVSSIMLGWPSRSTQPAMPLRRISSSGTLALWRVLENRRAWLLATRIMLARMAPTESANRSRKCVSS